jgi:hypothetical protein
MPSVFRFVEDGWQSRRGGRAVQIHFYRVTFPRLCTCSASNPGLTIRLRPFLSRISTLDSLGSSAHAPPHALPKTLLACLPPAASSTRKSTAGTNRAHDKTLSHSVRYVPARKPAFATLSRPSLSAWSCRNIAMRRESLQDGVRLALTPQPANRCASPKAHTSFQGKAEYAKLK